MSPEPAVLVERLGTGWLNAAANCLAPEEETRALRFHRPLDRDTWRSGVLQDQMELDMRHVIGHGLARGLF